MVHVYRFESLVALQSKGWLLPSGLINCCNSESPYSLLRKSRIVHSIVQTLDAVLPHDGRPVRLLKLALG